MKIFQNKTLIVVLFSVLTVLAVAGVIYGVASHSEPGLMENTPGWDRNDFPLGVCPEAYVSGDPRVLVDAQGAVGDAVDLINARLAFPALVVDYRECRVRVIVGAPAEPGWLDPGGDAHVSPKSCIARTSNVHGEVRDLVIQHELGHCLGLAHDSASGSIMRHTQVETPDRELPPWITDGDRSLLRTNFAPRPR